MITTRQRWQISNYSKFLQKILYIKYRGIRVLLSMLYIILLAPLSLIISPIYEMCKSFIEESKYTYQYSKDILKVANRKGD